MDRILSKQECLEKEVVGGVESYKHKDDKANNDCTAIRINKKELDELAKNKETLLAARKEASHAEAVAHAKDVAARAEARRLDSDNIKAVRAANSVETSKSSYTPTSASVPVPTPTGKVASLKAAFETKKGGYYEKYLKYKQKYLALKAQMGGY
jgi:hypothetical protein